MGQLETAFRMGRRVEMVNCTSDTIVNLMPTFDKTLIQIIYISIWNEMCDD